MLGYSQISVGVNGILCRNKKIALSFEIGEMDFFCGGFLRFKTHQVTFEIPSR